MEKLGFAFAVSRVITTQTVSSLEDRKWLMETLLILVGFTAYHMLTARVIDTSAIATGKHKNALDDVLYFGTMLVVARVLSGKSLVDEKWQKGCLYMLTGFVTFDYVTSYGVDRVTGSSVAKSNANDVLKFGTMYSVSRYLAGETFDKQWLVESGSFIVGLVLYNTIFLK